MGTGSIEDAMQACALGWRPDRPLEHSSNEMVGIWLPCTGMDRLVALGDDGTCADFHEGNTVSRCTWKGAIEIIGKSRMPSGVAYSGRESSSIGIYSNATGKADVYARVR